MLADIIPTIAEWIPLKNKLLSTDNNTTTAALYKRASPGEYGSFEKDAPLRKIQLDTRRRRHLENTNSCEPLTRIIGPYEDGIVETLAE
ncbi:unnamed protein product [Angiostrongylus costaricensis]|uniref:Transposase n=1 Tax=Angiostrongylus costaricensis TaxID=334426 RepID=A0A0R3PYR8_ANGCS|nr:unnamed protein product [Angiostrongylus costaricensis]